MSCDDGRSDETGSQVGDGAVISKSPSQPFEDKDKKDSSNGQEMRPVLIAKKGVSRYLYGAVWSNLASESATNRLDIDVVHLNDEVPQGKHVDHMGPESLLLATNSASKASDLTSLFPPIDALPYFQKCYADRVDPWMKILHLPTFYATLRTTLEHPEEVSNNRVALSFSFFLATATVMEADECHDVLGVKQTTLMARYLSATCQALVNANFLSTSSPTVLQAFAMFLMGARSFYSRESLYIYSGIAIRLARKMGLHRDGSSLGLLPFASEMRRRLWWHLVHMDFRMSESQSTRPSMDLSNRDTNFPLNVEDEDLDPTMTHPPIERKGITTIIICLIRCEIGDFLRKFAPISSPNDTHWELLGTTDMPIEKKDELIAEIEDRFEARYLRYCDPCNPLHHMVSIMIRSSICKMKVYAHNTRNVVAVGSGFTDTAALAHQSHDSQQQSRRQQQQEQEHPRNKSRQISQNDRDIIFTNASKILEYATFVPANSQLGKQMWQISTPFFWNMILYVLIEARHRKVGPQVDKMWVLIGKVLKEHRQILNSSTSSNDDHNSGGGGRINRKSIPTALRMWIVEVWDEYVVATTSAAAAATTITTSSFSMSSSSAATKPKQVVTPEYIKEIRRELPVTKQQQQQTRSAASNLSKATRNPQDQDQQLKQPQEQGYSDVPFPLPFSAMTLPTPESDIDAVEADHHAGSMPNDDLLRVSPSMATPYSNVDNNDDKDNYTFQEMPSAFAAFDGSFSDLLSFEMNANQWMQWEMLVAEEGG